MRLTAGPEDARRSKMDSPLLHTAGDVRILPKGKFPRTRLSSRANRENWLLARAVAGDASTPSEWIATISDRSTFVHWISDAKINTNYLLIIQLRGAHRDQLPSHPSASRAKSTVCSLAIADVDGDGKQDLIVPEHEGGRIGVRLNDGAGGLLDPVDSNISLPAHIGLFLDLGEARPCA